MKEEILFVGDLSFGDGPFEVGYGFDSIHHIDGYERVFSKIEHQLRNYKYVVGNFESIIGRRPSLKDIENWSMRCDQRICKQLSRANLKIVSMANNHSMDYGYDAFAHTADTLKKNGIKIIGLKEKPYEVIKVGSTRVALIGISYVNNSKLDLGFFYKPSMQDLDSLDSELNGLDNRVAYVHWGNEFVTFPTQEQYEIARQLANFRFNVIVGCHPHIVQKRGSMHGSIVYFSLGNFISTYKQKRMRDTLAISINPSSYEYINEHSFRIDFNLGIPHFIKTETIKLVELDGKLTSNKSIALERYRVRLESLLYLMFNFHKVSGKAKLINWLFGRLWYLLRFGIKEISSPNTIYEKYRNE